jgi:hypothetical protein
VVDGTTKIIPLAMAIVSGESSPGANSFCTYDMLILFSENEWLIFFLLVPYGHMHLCVSELYQLPILPVILNIQKIAMCVHHAIDSGKSFARGHLVGVACHPENENSFI